MKTILITIAILGIVLILTEKVFKQALLRFKNRSKSAERAINKEKYRKPLTQDELDGLKDKLAKRIESDKK